MGENQPEDLWVHVKIFLVVGHDGDIGVGTIQHLETTGKILGQILEKGLTLITVSVVNGLNMPMVSLRGVCERSRTTLAMFWIAMLFSYHGKS